MGSEMCIRDSSIDGDTFDRLHRGAKYLLDIRPAGRWPAEFFYYAGGVPAIMEEIRDVLHLDAMTITGKTLGENLDELKANGFYEHCQQLLDEEQHLLYLDSFGRTEGLLTEYREKYQAMAVLRRQMQALEMDEAEKARRVDTLTYQLQELERAKLRPGEEQELQSRRTLLHNAEKFISAVSGADFCLNGDDGSDGAANLVRQAQESLASVRGLDPELGELYDRLEAAYSEIYDLADTIRDKREDFDFSPQELDRVEGRLDQLYRLKKKYGPTVEELSLIHI